MLSSKGCQDDANKDRPQPAFKLNFGHLKWISNYRFVIFVRFSIMNGFSSWQLNNSIAAWDAY
jgi:hypothetical protein